MGFADALPDGTDHKKLGGQSTSEEIVILFGRKELKTERTGINTCPYL